MASKQRDAAQTPRTAKSKTEKRADVARHAPGASVPQSIEIGYQAFVSDGGEEFGAIREVYPDALVVYVENAGDFRIPRSAVDAVHSDKVIFACAKLSGSLRRAIGHAHDAEVPGA